MTIVTHVVVSILLSSRSRFVIAGITLIIIVAWETCFSTVVAAVKQRRVVALVTSSAAS